MRYLIAVLLSVVLVSGVFAQDEEIVLDFYYPVQVGGSVADVMQGYADSFNELNPNITVNVTYTGSYNQNNETVYTELNGGGDGPHVSIMGFSEVYTLSEMEAVLPVEDFIAAEGDLDSFVAQYIPAYLDYTDEGTLWALPFQRSTAILYYNKDLFEAAGLDPEQPPRNREELVEYAQVLTTDDVWGFGMVTADAWLFHPFALASGEPVWDGDPAQVNFNSPGVVNAAQFLASLVHEYGVQSPDVMGWGDVSNEFMSGNIAMILHSTGAMSNHIDNSPFDVGVGFIPAGAPGEDGTGYATVTGGANIYIFDRGTDAEKQAAFEWVKFLTSAESQAIWGQETGYIAANLGAWETAEFQEFLEERPQASIARAQLEFAGPSLATYSSDTWTILSDALQSIIVGEADAQEALDQAQQLADSALEAYR